MSSEAASKRSSSTCNNDSDENKKAKTTTSSTAQTPYDEYWATKKAFHAVHKDLIGSLMIRGIEKKSSSDSDEDEDYDESETEEDRASYTKEQMQSVRYVLLTKERIKAIEELQDALVGDECMFTTSYSYAVRDYFFDVKFRLSKMKNWKEKFDLLFSYTYVIGQYETWMQDNEGDMNDMVLDLAKLWKAMLKKSDEDLGIDAEYTRPGVITLLEQFKKDIEDAYARPKHRFNFS